VNAILKLVNFYIYSSLHIGLAAVALIFQTAQLFDIQVSLYYYLFGFAATVFIYCTHRIIGFQRMPSWIKEGRFTIIKQYASHIKVYAALGLIACIVLFFFLPLNVMLYLVLPSIFSITYVLPVFKNKYRLRDYNYIKIFLIAVVWAYITALIPMLFGADQLSITSRSLIVAERILFVFAITIPFDIRDHEIDKETNVNTLVHALGIEGAKRLSIVTVFLILLINFSLRTQGILSDTAYFTLFSFYILLMFVIIYASKQKSDYYYSGLLDGTMILCPLMIYFFA